MNAGNKGEKNQKSKLTITKNMKQRKPNRNFHLKHLPSPSPKKRENFFSQKLGFGHKREAEQERKKNLTIPKNQIEKAQ